MTHENCGAIILDSDPNSGYVYLLLPFLQNPRGGIFTKIERSLYHLIVKFVKPIYLINQRILPASVCRNAQGAFPCKNPIYKENGVKI